MSQFEQIHGRSPVRAHGAMSIPGAIPLDNGFAGVNRKLLKEDASGLPILIPSTLLLAGDRVDVCIRRIDTPLLSFVVPQPHDIDSPLSRFIEAERVPEGFGELFYRVNGAESADLKILVRKHSPGGVDPAPKLPGHGLLRAPRLGASEVDDSQDVTVTILPWRGMQRGHRVNLQLSDRCLPHTVTSDEEGGPITFTIAKETLAELGHCDTLLFYKLWDEVGNPASDRSQTSELRIRPSSTGAMGMVQQAPVILGVNQDKVIDLAGLDGKDVTVEVDVAANGLAVGQQVKLHWRGEPVDGPLQLLTWTQPVGQAPSVVFTINSTELSALVGSWISAAWTLVGGDEFQVSPAAECLLLDSSQTMVLEEEDPSLLSLSWPIVPGAILSVEGSEARIGIPKLIYDGLTDGLKVIINPWRLIAANDTCRLRLNGETAPVDIKIVLPGQEQDDLILYVPPQRLLDGINTLVYSAQRPSENEASSEPITMLYHEVRPGNKDLDPGTEGHSELKLEFPVAENAGIDIVKEGLDGRLQQLTVHCRYPYCRPYDHINIDFGDSIVHFSVPFDQAPPVASTTPTTVSVVITGADLNSIRDRRAMPVSFTVTDVLQNTTDPSAIWSATVYIDVDRQNNRLPAPIFCEDLSDNNDAPEIIDLDKLAGADLSLIIQTIHSSYRAGDEVSAIFRSPSAPDFAVPVGIVTEEIGQPKPLVLRVPNRLLVSDTTVSCSYDTRFKTLNQEGYSKTAYAQVVGFGSLKLPNLLEASGEGAEQRLAPLDAINGATVRIAFAGLLATDMIKLTLTGAPGAGTPNIAPVPGEADGSVDIPIPASVIAANIGNGVNSTFTLRYEVIRGTQTTPSGTVTVTVSPLPSSSLVSPVFFINNAETLNVLDLSSFTGDAVIRAKTWSFIAAEQQVRMTLEGRTADNKPSDRPVWSGGRSRVNPQWVTDGFWPVTIPRSYLETLGDDTQLLIKFSASLDVRDNPATDIDFPDRVYRVGKAGQAPTITSVTANGTEIPNGGETSLSLITVTGTITPGRPVDLYDGTVRLGAGSVTGTTWTFGPLDFAEGVHALTARAQDGTVSFPPRIFKIVTDAQVPTITAVTTDEGNVPYGNTTYYRKASVTGTGTAGQSVELLDNNVSIGRYVAHNGVWSVPTRLFSATTHVLTVRRVDGSNKSSTYVFEVKEGLEKDVVPFSHGKDERWAWGGAGAEHDVGWKFYSQPGYYHRYIKTHTNSSAGLVLFKSFADLTPGATYLLSASVLRDNGPFSAPRLQLTTSAGDKSAIYTLAVQYAQTSLSLEFVASSPNMTMQVMNHEPSGEGNDFAIGHIQIEKKKLPS